MRRAAIVAAAAAAGVAVGVAVAFLSGGSERAVATVAVTRGGTPVAAASVAALARTSQLAQNVEQATHVRVGGRLHASVVHGTALVRLAFDDPSSRVRAAQVVQQAAATLEALTRARFPALAVTVVDPPRAVGTQRHLVRDTVLFALLGALVGCAAVVVPRRRPEKVSDTSKVSDTGAVPREPVAEPEPEPEPAPEPEPDPEPAPASAGSFAELRAAVDAHRGAFTPEQVAEWGAYLDALEPHARDGRLPPHLQGMLDDVLEPLLVRIRS